MEFSVNNPRKIIFGNDDEMAVINTIVGRTSPAEVYRLLPALDPDFVTHAMQTFYDHCKDYLRNR